MEMKMHLQPNRKRWRCGPNQDIYRGTV